MVLGWPRRIAFVLGSRSPLLFESADADHARPPHVLCVNRAVGVFPRAGSQGLTRPLHTIGQSIERSAVELPAANSPFTPDCAWSVVLSERLRTLDTSFAIGVTRHVPSLAPPHCEAKPKQPSRRWHSHREALSGRRTEIESARKGGNISSAGGTIIYRRGRGGTQREDRGSTTAGRGRDEKFGEDEGSGQASCGSRVRADWASRKFKKSEGGAIHWF